MPELPEVQVLVQSLQQTLPGRTINKVTICREKSVRPDSATAFVKRLKGLQFQSVQRRAKYLLFNLCDRAESLQILGHLGMTGRMFLQSKKSQRPKHTALWMELDRGNFVFEDTRYFGRMSFNLDALDRLGPEPLSDDFELAGFREKLKRSRQAIKVRLLATDLVVGVGNIYASEALYRSRIHPQTPANQITAIQARRLHKAIRETLGEAIELGSSLALDWAGKQNRDGLFYFGGQQQSSDEERFFVYGKEGDPCIRCGAGIRRLVQAARSTFFCPRCQKMS